MPPLVSVLLLLMPLVDALPVSSYPLPSVQSCPLVFVLSLLPLPILGLVKFVYLRFRRGQSIHALDYKLSPSLVPSVSVPLPPTISSKFNLNCDFTPYLVGCLGSPEWETRIGCRIDRLARRSRPPSSTTSQPSSARLFSHILGDDPSDPSRSTANDSSVPTTRARRSLSHPHSRTPSVSFLDMNSPRLPPDITNCASVHPSTPPCYYDAPLPAVPPPAHILRKSHPEFSPTLMQIMQPVLSSWSQDNTNQTTLQDNSSVIDTSQEKSASAPHSPTPPFQTPPTSPSSPNMRPSHSVPPITFSVFRKQLTLSTSSSILNFGSPNSLSFALFQSPVLSVPAPVHTPKARPESFGVLPQQWRSDVCTPRTDLPAIQLLQSPTHQSPAAASNLFDVVPTPVRVPFAATTRPLNVSPKPASSLPPSPTIPLSMPKHPALQLQRRKSGSPPIGPSPLRRSSLRQSSSYPASVSSSDLGVRLRASATTVSTTRGSWELEDLVRDGQLDIDAVSAVLGLGLGLGMDAGSRSSAASSADGEQDECAMERASMGWGRAREAGTTVLQLRVPGEPLFAIPEETGAEDAATAGEPEHGSNARRECVVSVSLDHLFVSANAGEVSEGSVCAEIGVWEDERSWRESVSIRDSIGVAW